MNKIFSKYADYYDILYKDKNYNKESDYIEKIINRFAGKKLRILELGCGSGGHAFNLQKKGHKIVALDSSKKMIKIAQKKNKQKKIKFLNKDLTKFISKKKFDVIILLFHVVNFLKTKKDLKILSDNSYKNLKKNGIIIFDFINYDGVISDKPKKKIKIIKNKSITIIRKTRPEFIQKKRLLNINFEMVVKKNNEFIERFFEIHKLKLHSTSAIEKIFNKNFYLVNIFKWMEFKKFLKNNWLGLYILKKI